MTYTLVQILRLVCVLARERLESRKTARRPVGGHVGTPRRFLRSAVQVSAAGLLLLLTRVNPASADTPPGAPAESSSSEAQASLSQQNFISSVKQSLRMGYDHEAVRGHFDLGAPPNSHRYYCLVDTKTRRREPNGVLGQPVLLRDGTTALKVESVSLFGCDDAEKHGLLVTAGYVLAAAPPSAAPPAPPPPPPPPTPSRSIGATRTAAAARAHAGGGADLRQRRPRRTKSTSPASGSGCRWMRFGRRSRPRSCGNITSRRKPLGYLDLASAARCQSIADGRCSWNVVAAWTPARRPATALKGMGSRTRSCSRPSRAGNGPWRSSTRSGTRRPMPFTKSLSKTA